MNTLDLTTAVILASQAMIDGENNSLLTLEDRDKISKINIKNNYGISQSVLRNLIKNHKAARSKNDLHEMELIEYRLTDINFHSECGLISKGLYKEAFEMVDDW